jgi:hypothetical protein
VLPPLAAALPTVRPPRLLLLRLVLVPRRLRVLLLLN